MRSNRRWVSREERGRILVMDEPTAALSSRETQRLFDLILRLRDEGMAAGAG
jgi:ABC-type sugar transport system ATPase subunit